MADSLGMTFPIPIPVIMQDTKKGVNPESIQQESLDVQKESLKIQMEMGDYSENLNSMFVDQLDLLGQVADKPAIKQTKEKQLKFWDKIFKNKTFEGIWKGIKGIASSLSSGFMDMLLGLMIWAFIDPNGSLMISLIGIFVSLSVMVLKIFARMIPAVLKLIIKVLPVLVKAFMTIAETIISLIPQVVVGIVDAIIMATKLIGDKLPFLKPILNFIDQLALAIRDLFDPNSPLGVKERLKIFAIEVLSILGGLLLEGLKLLGGLILEGFGWIKDAIVGEIDSITNAFKNFMFESFGEKGLKMAEGLGLALKALGIYIGMLGVLFLYEKIMLGLQMAKNFVTLQAIPAMISYAASMWATLAPILAVIGVVLLLIAAFVLIYTYWDDIVNFFSDLGKKIYKWFVEEALDWILLAIRVLMLPFTYPLEIAWYIYNNWDKIKKKLMPTIKFLLDKFSQFVDSIKRIVNDLFGNIKIPNLKEILTKAFEDALSGLGRLLDRIFSSIPGAERIEKSFKEFVDWFMQSKFVKWIKSFSDSDEKDKKKVENFKKAILGVESGGSAEVIEAQKKFKESNTSAEALRHVLMGGKVSELNLSQKKQEDLEKAIKELKQGDLKNQYENIQKEIEKGTDMKSLSDAIYKLATQKPFQSIIGAMGNATLQNAGGN